MEVAGCFAGYHRIFHNNCISICVISVSKFCEAKFEQCKFNKIYGIMRSLLAAFAVIFSIFVLSSCISDEISTSSSDRLTFSCDTVSFDTVFTDLGTPTARLKVFNRNKKGVNISQIRFKRDDSNFTVNVDGVSGKVFKDVEIRGGDSIYIFIECFIPETSSKKPALVEDELVFLTNGVEQKVLCEAWGQNVKRLRNHRVESGTMRLTADMPYVVFDSLYVAKGATLKVDPGVQLLFHDGGSLVVDGTLEAVGKRGRMIDMRGDRLDNVLTDVAYDILAGQWKGIRIGKDSYDNRMEYVDMRSTVHGVMVDSCANLERQKLTLLNSWLHNSQHCALQSRYAKVDAYGCVFSEAADAVVRLFGGKHEFAQCTISNYYLFSAITEPLLTLWHLFPDDLKDGNMQPLMELNFDNGIIYGLGTDINHGDLAGSNVYLRNVLLKSEGTNDANFINCLWGEDPLFETVREDYYFNYHLQEDSPAFGAGDPAYVKPLWQWDMDGIDRLGAGNPTLGAFVK